MYVPFASLAPSSRIWIFQSTKVLSERDQSLIHTRLRAFTEQWGAHGIPLKSGFDIRFNRFIILGADEDHHHPSGCSIDSSFRILKEIERETGTNLFDRNLVAFFQAKEIFLVPVKELKQKQ